MSRLTYSVLFTGIREQFNACTHSIELCLLKGRKEDFSFNIFSKCYRARSYNNKCMSYNKNSAHLDRNSG